MHIFPNILRNKGNQTIKFGQIIEFNMKSIFLEKLYTKNDAETIPIFFSKVFKSLKSISNSLKFYAICFDCMSKLKALKADWN